MRLPPLQAIERPRLSGSLVIIGVLAAYAAFYLLVLYLRWRRLR